MILLKLYQQDHLSWLRREDSNLRPSGYEPDKLPAAPLRGINCCTQPGRSFALLLRLLVLVAGLEPARRLIRRILSPLRLPVPPHEQDALVVCWIMIALNQTLVKHQFYAMSL